MALAIKRLAIRAAARLAKYGAVTVGRQLQDAVVLDVGKIQRSIGVDGRPSVNAIEVAHRTLDAPPCSDVCEKRLMKRRSPGFGMIQSVRGLTYRLSFHNRDVGSNRLERKFLMLVIDPHVHPLTNGPL